MNDDLRKAAESLFDYIRINYNPHAIAIVSADMVEVVRGVEMAKLPINATTEKNSVVQSKGAIND